MSKIYLTILFTVLSLNFCYGQNAIDIHIAKFKDNKAAAISYTFDDGLKEHNTLVTPWLKKLGLKGTFVINGSKINEDPNAIKDTTRMTWKDLKEMAASGQEISNHGWAHRNFGKFTLAEIEEDIKKNDSAIYANIGAIPRTFAYPNNTKSTEGIKIANKNRVGTRLFQRSIGGKATAENLEDWVNKLLKDQDWGVGMTHGITYGYDHFGNPSIFWDHLKKVKALEDKIWIGTFREVVAYVNERDSTVIKIKQNTNTHYIITATCSLDKTLFTEPLTAILEEGGIKKIKISQGKQKLIPKILPNKVLFNFDPFGDLIEIEIKKKK
ncbi:polysaccharide deacetylase family protein [Pedobacter cryophilus]|uniref:Polysaccharide deacetylase family protein n=1 Tax=Pedobacter cryophilus TaxID=2571271 RepID=A0A4U1BUA1_9SPHI|nr:polysaccharide deacetylase family protein [Pedobacter cryophilus]TKB95234.1 polysaccharide deacetylase family protein [Pedobacter cryophilus]